MNGFLRLGCGFQKILEQRTIVHHRLPEIFGARMSACMFLCDVARRAIVHHHIRVINRNVLNASFEVADRIAARVHHFAYQPISLRDGGLGVVDELSLHLTPRFREPVDIRAGELDDMQPCDALGASLQRGLCLGDVTGRPNRTLGIPRQIATLAVESGVVARRTSLLRPQ